MTPIPAEFVAELTSLPVAAIESLFTANTTTPFQPSMLFDSAKESKFVDESLRSSEFRLFEDKRSFDTFDDSIMMHLNDPTKNPIAAHKKFQLVRSDITEILYPIGGFFKKHKDFLSVTSNSITEFTLIVCLPVKGGSGDDVVEGGETLIHVNGATLASKMTTTPGNALLFRKDLEHEGAKLLKGGKRIITVNLWAIDKPSSSDVKLGILLVTFPSTPSTPPSSPDPKRRKLEGGSSYEGGSSSSSSGAELRTLSKSATSKNYAIKVSTILSGPGRDSFFAGLVRFNTTGIGDSSGSDSDDNARAPIFRHECEGTYESFKGIYNLLTGCRSSPAEVDASASLFNFYNLDTRCILADLAANPRASDVPDASDASPAPSPPPATNASPSCSNSSLRAGNSFVRRALGRASTWGTCPPPDVRPRRN